MGAAPELARRGPVQQVLAAICGSICGGSFKAPAGPRPAAEDLVPVGSYVVEHQGNFKEFYDVQGNELGSGAYGSVSKAHHKVTKAVRAIKTVSKIQAARTEKALQQLHLEINIMKRMDHPGIIKLYETFEDKKNIYLVMELCTGGELFDRIVEVGHFTESQAAIIMQQMISAVYYMHAKEICHRDLKPENFLFSSKEPIEAACLKLIDFGLSAAFRKKKFTTRAGTPYYVAPQVLQGSYDQACDLWSCGVIMYVLLCGEPPFYGETDREILDKVRKGHFIFDPQDWDTVSEDAKDLVGKLLTMRPQHRYTAEQALHHVWIREKAPRSGDTQLRSGLVEKSEFREILIRMMKVPADADLPDCRVASLWQELDQDRSGEASFEEFLAWWFSRKDVLIHYHDFYRRVRDLRSMRPDPPAYGAGDGEASGGADEADEGGR